MRNRTLGLVVDRAEGSTAAFGGPFPNSGCSQVAGYAVVNLILYLAGFGLILLGHRLAARRRARRGPQRPVSLDPVA